MKRARLWLGVFVLIGLLLAGGAYTAVQLLARPEAAAAKAAGGGRAMQSVQVWGERRGGRVGAEVLDLVPPAGGALA